METFVARQPIFDRQLHVFGYELLFRSGMVDTFDGTNDEIATAKVMSFRLNSPHPERIRGGKPAFVNFSRKLLLNQSAAILPPQDTIIEVLESVEPDADIIAACKRLRALGYRIALDDFAWQDVRNPLIPLADFLKVDFRMCAESEIQQIVDRFQSRVALLAEKVETQEEFLHARELGFAYFQGYFFARPVISSMQETPGFRLHYMRLLQEIHRPELDVDELGRIIETEPLLSYKLLRFVNSALFPLRRRIGSIRRALLYIGCDKARMWLSVIVLIDVTSDKPAELVFSTLVRARFCELLAPDADLGTRSKDVFLLGLFSRLDVMLGRPLDQLLDGLSLPDDISRTLLNQDLPTDRVADLWRSVLAYESANWAELAERAPRAGIPCESMPMRFAASIDWTEEVFRA